MKKLLAVAVISLILLVVFATPALALDGSLPETGESGVEGGGFIECEDGEATIGGSITLPTGDTIDKSLELPAGP